MDEVSELAAQARGLFDAVVRLTIELLDAGADPQRVHARYLDSAMNLREEVEVRAVLASAGDPGALQRLALLVEELRTLRTEARAELQRSLGDRRDE